MSSLSDRFPLSRKIAARAALVHSVVVMAKRNKRKGKRRRKGGVGKPSEAERKTRSGASAQSAASTDAESPASKDAESTASKDAASAVSKDAQRPTSKEAASAVSKDAQSPTSKDAASPDPSPAPEPAIASVAPAVERRVHPRVATREAQRAVVSDSDTSTGNTVAAWTAKSGGVWRGMAVALPFAFLLATQFALFARSPMASELSLLELLAIIGVFAGLPALLGFAGLGRNLARRAGSAMARVRAGSVLGALLGLALGILAGVPIGVVSLADATPLLVGSALLGALVGACLAMWTQAA